jgi:hypothetical protein
MFHQVHFSDWGGVVAVIAFLASSGVFLFFLVGALRTSPERIEREAARPLEKETLL